MRVTQNMIANRSLANLSNSYRMMDKYNQQTSTGRKINLPSDDPVVAMKGMYYRTNLTEIEQYQRNLSELYSWLENSEAGVEQVNSAMQRARELVVYMKNGTNTAQDLQATSREIDQIKQDLVQVGNSQVAGNYIFNGAQVDKAPVDGSVNPPKVTLNTDEYGVEVSRGVKLRANVDPTQIFSQGLFDTLQLIQNIMAGTEPRSQLDQALTQVDFHMDKISAERSELGARYNRLEMIDNRLASQNVIANRVLSDNEDADMEKVITDMKVQESVHRAALGVGARIIQPTLLDFLR